MNHRRKYNLTFPAEKKGKVSERERFPTLSEFYVNFASEIFPKISDSFPNVPVTRFETFWSLSEVSHYLVHSEFFLNSFRITVQQIN